MARRGHRVGVVGNTNTETEQFLRERCGADFVASSAGLGAAKPAPEFFAAIARLAEAEPGEIVYVGDRVDNDVLPAIAAGMVGGAPAPRAVGASARRPGPRRRAHTCASTRSRSCPGRSRPSGTRLRMVRLDDDAFVRDQYASTAQARDAHLGLAAGRRRADRRRMSRWPRWPSAHPAGCSRSAAGRARSPSAAAAELGCEVVALDRLGRDGAGDRGARRHAVVGDVTRLPFADGEFDCAVAAWMLYHVADLRHGGRRARPRPCTRRPAGGDHKRRASICASCTRRSAARSSSPPSAARTAPSCSRGTSPVSSAPTSRRAPSFADRAAAAAYLATLGREELAERLPEFTEPLVASGAPTVFVADKA